MMLAGPKRAVSGPKMSRPGRTGSSRTVGGLIRERPVSVNVSGCRIYGSSKRRNSSEYSGISGVFQCEDGNSPTGR